MIKSRGNNLKIVIWPGIIKNDQTILFEHFLIKIPLQLKMISSMSILLLVCLAVVESQFGKY